MYMEIQRACHEYICFKANITDLHIKKNDMVLFLFHGPLGNNMQQSFNITLLFLGI